MTWQVGHDEVTAANAGIEQGRHRLGRHVTTVGAPPGQDAQLVDAGQPAVQRVGRDPAARAVEVTPSQPCLSLAAHHEVDASPERVAVDEQAAVTQPQAR